MKEFEKYKEIYSGLVGEDYQKTHGEGYGRGFWGENAINFILNESPKSVLDVGCGYGRFCDAISDKVDSVYGLDIASVITDNVIKNSNIKFMHGEAKNLPFENNSVEWITSFDCLEHCLTEDIDKIFDEFDRVSTKGWVLSISYLPDAHKDTILHMTVQPENWWIEKIEKYGKVTLGELIGNSNNRYIILKK